MAIVEFGDIVRDVKINVDRSNNPYSHYVAGDHMDSEDLTIHRCGNFATDDVGPAFTRIFKPGQILYGSRRTYLKKVAVADFEGICANTTFVLESKDETIFDNRLLPFVMLSDSFTRWSISHSKGSTNPYVLFSDLAGYEFNLPSIEEQRVLVDKLWAAYRLKESYKKLLAATQEMVKSQFIEMFTNNNFEMVPLGDLCDKISDGSHNPPKGIENSKYLMISSKNVFKDHLDLTDVRYLTEEDFEVENKRTNVKANDVLLTIVGTIGRTYLVKGDEGNLVMQRSVAVLTPNSRVTPLFLMFYLHSDKNLEKEGRGNAQKGIYLKQLSQYEIKVPSIDLQKQFEAIYRQADKSEFELRKSIESIDAVIKSLINS